MIFPLDIFGDRRGVDGLVKRPAKTSQNLHISSLSLFVHVTKHKWNDFEMPLEKIESVHEVSNVMYACLSGLKFKRTLKKRLKYFISLEDFPALFPECNWNLRTIHTTVYNMNKTTFINRGNSTEREKRVLKIVPKLFCS